jgi:hypothetical protein
LSILAQMKAVLVAFALCVALAVGQTRPHVPLQFHM